MRKERRPIITISKLTIKDVERFKKEIALMLKQSYEKSFPKDSYELSYFYDRVQSLVEYLNEEKALLYGKFKNNNLAGFVWFFEKDINGGRVIHINHFVVDRIFRHLGVGGSLWNAVENYANKKGIEGIELHVTKNNEEAVNFYKKRNFEIERFVMKKRL